MRRGWSVSVANKPPVACHGARLGVPANGAPSAADGMPTVYGIRPEHFRLADNGLQARIQVLEPTGSETHVIARVGEIPLVLAFRERISARPGETIGILPDPTLAHLFERDSGRRLN